jgi:DNA modification methylase
MNRLNELTGKEWVKLTKTVWYNDAKPLPKDINTAIERGVLLSESPPRDILKKLHPATFSEKDIAKLIKFFTKQKEVVLDPFMGTGSSGIAALQNYRKFIGIELYPNWFDIARQRIENYAKHDIFLANYYKLYLGDSLNVMKNYIDSNSIDFIVTSPPYWNILKKVDRKAKLERLNQELNTNYGNLKEDLGNLNSYDEFLSRLKDYISEMYRVLKDKKYIAIIVSDFRHKSKYYLFHADVAAILESVGFTLQGLITLVQDSKKLYAYGFPTTFVPNISNQFILIARKFEEKRNG